MPSLRGSPRGRLVSCPHPSDRLYAWKAFDGEWCVCFCECGEVLWGAAEDEGGEEEK